jgi:hypothetical protein
MQLWTYQLKLISEFGRKMNKMLELIVAQLQLLCGRGSCHSATG